MGEPDSSGSGVTDTRRGSLFRLEPTGPDIGVRNHGPRDHHDGRPRHRPTTTTTTAAPTTTTTQSPDERLAEIEALVEDAIIGRLQAVYDRDAEALFYWVASQKEYDDGLAAMDRLNYLVRPDEDVVTVMGSKRFS